MTREPTNMEFRSLWQRRFSGEPEATPSMLSDDLPGFMGLPVVTDAIDLKAYDVAIIGVPYDRPATPGRPAGAWDGYRDAPDNLRRSSLRFGGYVPELDLEVFEHLKVADFGNADIVEGDDAASIAAVIAKTEEAVAAGCRVVTIGGFSPCASYSPAGAIARHAGGPVGVVSLDAHGDCLDEEPGRGSAPSAATWERRMWEDFPNIDPQRHVEIGMRGPRNLRQMVEAYRERGAQWVPASIVHRDGIEAVCETAFPRVFDGAAATWMHLDMDVLDIGAAPDWGDEPMGLSVREIVHVTHQAALRGLNGLSFVYVAPRSEAIAAIVCYTIIYYLAGLVNADQSN